MEQQEIKNKIYSSLDKLRSNTKFNGFRNTKLLEIIGTTQGTENLKVY